MRLNGVLATSCLLLAHLGFTSKALAGAISAGGMEAPYKIECLFVDPVAPTEPLNFIVYDFSQDANPAMLVKADLVSRKMKTNYRLENVAPVRSQGMLIYAARIVPSGVAVNVAIKDSNPLSYDRYIHLFAGLSRLPGVEFLPEATGYEAAMTFDDRTYNGICTNKGALFYYTLDRRNGSIR